MIKVTSDFQERISDQKLTSQQGCACAAVGKVIQSAANGLYVWVSHLPLRHLPMPLSDVELVSICGCTWRDRYSLLFFLRLSRSRVRKSSEEVLTWSRGAFCCACPVNFSLIRETAGMRLRRFPFRESRKKRSSKIRRKKQWFEYLRQPFFSFFLL